MNIVVLVVIAAVNIWFYVATIVTIWWQNKSELRKNKMKILQTLMAYRYMIFSQECVDALNSIDVVFYKDTAVRKAYADLLQECAKKPGV